MAETVPKHTITKDTEVGTSELAAVLGVTARRVQQMAQDKTVDTVRRGRFNLCHSVGRYIDFITREKEQSAPERERIDAEVSIKKAKAIVAVLNAKEVQGKMHRSEDVAAMTEDLIYAIRGMLMALPGRLAVDAAGLSTPAEISELVRTEVYAIMEELSRYAYDPKKYEERVRERMRWENKEGGDVGDESS